MTAVAENPGLLRTAGRFFVDPRSSVQALIAARPSEGLLLFLAMFSAFLIFLRKSGSMLLETDVDEQTLRLFSEQLVASLFFVPIGMYLFAAIGTMLARVCGGTGTWYDGRIAFFWASAIAAPIMLITANLIIVAPGMEPILATLIAQIGFFFFPWAIAQCFSAAFGFTRTWLVLIVTCSPAIILFALYVITVLA